MHIKSEISHVQFVPEIGGEQVALGQGVQFGLPTQGISVNNGAFTPKVPVVASKKPPKSFFRPQV